jgi:hypothetical protein
VTIVPYVMTWDRVVAEYHERYTTMIGLSKRVEAYIQSAALKKTLEIIANAFHVEEQRGEGPEDVFKAIDRMMAKASVGAAEVRWQRREMGKQLVHPG